MMKRKIFRYIFLCIIEMAGIVATHAQSHKHSEAVIGDTVDFIMEKQVFVNAAGIVLWQFSDYGEIEGGLRLNIKGKYFPTVEAGLGVCDKTHDETDIHYKTSAPFLRIGCDYNFMKNRKSPNRIFGGLRFGFTSFKYDMDAPPLDDPYWNDSQLAFNFKKVKGNASWCEFVFGLETKIWQHLRLGWTARYKRRLSHKTTDLGKAWYVPGYGENNGHLFTGTFNVVFSF